MINQRNIIEKVGNTEIEMVHVPAGEYLMGAPEGEAGYRENEGPQHMVAVPEFYLGKYTITQNQWFEIMRSVPEMGSAFRGNELPVVNVWLELAVEYCQRLSAISRRSYRLPTEAEWEYACRAGTDTPFCFGDNLPTSQANFDGREPYTAETHGEFRGHTTPAGFFDTSNALGINDMHGNVWEWCADIWHEDYTGAPSDGSAWTSGGDQSYCVQRGGSWQDRASNCRSAFRVGDTAHNSGNIVGLRVALDFHSVVKSVAGVSRSKSGCR